MAKSYLPQPHLLYVSDLPSLTQKEKRRMDNEVNKINKRLIAAAKLGMSADSFKALSSLVYEFKGRILAEQMDVLGIKTKKGVEHVPGVVNPITIKRITLDNGQTVEVPQIRRATWVLRSITKEEHDKMLEITTAQSETTAVEKYLTAVGKDVTNANIRQHLEKFEQKEDFYRFVYEWLYDYKDKYSEIKAFLDGITGISNDGSNNSKAIALYHKYSVLENEPHDRPLTEKEVAYINNRKQEAQIRYYQSQTDEQKRQAVSDYLTYSSARGEFGDNPLSYDYPSEEDVTNQLEELAENNTSWR